MAEPNLDNPENISIEALVATTNQTDLSLFKKMNLHCDTIFANQCVTNDYKEEMIDGYRVRMISTDTRGVGINRNIAMQFSNAKICVLSDDDITYENDAFENIAKAFKENPKADIIGFSLKADKPENARLNNKSGRTFKNFGAARMAYRNSSVQRANLSFSRLFGGGAPFSSGEDTLFCINARKAKLKLLMNECIIGTHGDRESTWFKGYTDKFYEDRGSLFAVAYPKLKNIMCIQLLIRRPEIYKQGGKSFFQAYKLMRKGFSKIRHEISAE